MNIKIFIVLLLLFNLLSISNGLKNGDINSSDINYNDPDSAVYAIHSLFNRVSTLENLIVSLEERIANSAQCNCTQSVSVNVEDIISKIETKFKTSGIKTSSIEINDQWIIRPEQLGDQYLVFRQKTYNKLSDKRIAMNGASYKDL